MKYFILALLALTLTACTPDEKYNPVDKILCDPTNAQAYMTAYQRHYQVKRTPSADALCVEYKAKL